MAIGMMQPYLRVNGIQMKILGLPQSSAIMWPLKLRRSHALKRRDIQKCDSCRDIISAVS